MFHLQLRFGLRSVSGTFLQQRQEGLTACFVENGCNELRSSPQNVFFLGTILAAVRIHSTPAKPRRETRISSIFLSQHSAGRLRATAEVVQDVNECTACSISCTYLRTVALSSALVLASEGSNLILFARSIHSSSLIGVLEPCHKN